MSDNSCCSRGMFIEGHLVGISSLERMRKLLQLRPISGTSKQEHAADTGGKAAETFNKSDCVEVVEGLRVKILWKISCCI